MIVKIEGPIETFAKWKAMVHSNSEKIKKYGMTFLYAGSEKGDETKITAIIRFDTMEGLEGFKADDELHKERAAAGVDLANSVTTLMGDDLLEQYKG
ncbi:hypothetical protein OAO28_02255 [Candidatus Pelagibacter sp.]|nr:hypothetical protein [Candidatus Pelagibacter sp.]